jgi:hypothetical protein
MGIEISRQAGPVAATPEEALKDIERTALRPIRGEREAAGRRVVAGWLRGVRGILTDDGERLLSREAREAIRFIGEADSETLERFTSRINASEGVIDAGAFVRYVNTVARATLNVAKGAGDVGRDSAIKAFNGVLNVSEEGANARLKKAGVEAGILTVLVEEVAFAQADGAGEFLERGAAGALRGGRDLARDIGLLAVTTLGLAAETLERRNAADALDSSERLRMRDGESEAAAKIPSALNEEALMQNLGLSRAEADELTEGIRNSPEFMRLVDSGVQIDTASALSVAYLIALRRGADMDPEGAESFLDDDGVKRTLGVGWYKRHTLAGAKVMAKRKPILDPGQKRGLKEELLQTVGDEHVDLNRGEFVQPKGKGKKGDDAEGRGEGELSMAA